MLKNPHNDTVSASAIKQQMDLNISDSASLILQHSGHGWIYLPEGWKGGFLRPLVLSYLLPFLRVYKTLSTVIILLSATIYTMYIGADMMLNSPFSTKTLEKWSKCCPKQVKWHIGIWNLRNNLDSAKII